MAEARALTHKDDLSPYADEGLVTMVLDAIAAYLEGITILEHYNENSRLTQKEYFFGIDSEGQMSRRIGVSTYPFVFPKKIASTRKRAFKFFK